MEIEYTYNQYVDDILTGRIKSCEAIYLACERYKAFMNRSDMYFDEEDVQRKIRVVSRLKHSTGIHNGKSFILLPWQQWCIASIFGFKWKSTGYRVTKNAFIMVSRKGGKALALDTKIPTPEGFTTMGSLKVGDQVFDENSKPCNVTFVTPVMYDHKCYNITFSDGEVITADEDHNWYVQRYRSKWHVETTRDIILNGIEGVKVPTCDSSTFDKGVKYITKIEETESVPVKCITVDSPNHLYLCGNNTVTHNTATAAAIGILCAIADNEPGAEIDLVANSRHQAKIAFKQSSNFCESVDRDKKIFKRYRDTINIPKTKSIIQVLSSDAMGNDGYNASCFILDEFHAARSWDLYNVLKSSQGMRSQPLSIIITSAGFLLNGYPCYEHRLTCMDILKGNKVDDTQFSAIYELDEEDDWLDESNWIKCAPSLGQTVQIDYLRDQVQSVKNNPSLETGVKTKNFNIFCQSKNVWIPEKYLKDVWHKVDVDNFIDEDCYMGVDLSSVSDITASAIMFPPNPERAIYPDKYVFKPYVYLPVDNLAENTNEELYKLWYRQGFLDCTPGNVVDYDQILKDQIDIYNKTYLQNVAYDEWNASSWAADAYAEGLPIKGYSQTVGNFNKPTKTFEMLIRSGKVIIDYNPLVRWCFNNVEIKMDVNGNCKPMKGGSSNRKADRNGTNTKKIDPIIAMLEALGGYLDKHMNGVSDGQVLSV